MEEELSDNEEPSASVFDEYRTQVFTYHRMENYSSTWNHFENCRQAGKFTDIVIKVDDREFCCHKILLDACCPYFSACFSFSSPENQSIIHLKGVSLSGFSKLIDFMYTAKLTVAADDVIDVLECADFLQLRDLVQACSGFLFQHIDAETCLKIFQLSDAHSLPHLREESWNYIQSHFKDVSENEAFMHISKELLVKIITSETLRVQSESVILKSVLHWVIFKYASRKNELNSLIPLLGVNDSDFEDSEILLNYGKEVLDAIQRHIGGSRVRRLEEVMVVVSRDTSPSRSKMNNIFFYNPATERWDTLTSFPFNKRHHFAVACLKNRIYITGGVTTEVPLYDRCKEIFTESWEYDVLTDSWKAVTPMISARYNHSTAALQDSVYVVGGRGNRRITVRPDGEVYNVIANQWTGLPAIKEVQGIGNASLTALDGRLYLLGGMHSCVSAGRRDVTFDTYKGAQYYSMRDNEWHHLDNLGIKIEDTDLKLSRTDCVAIQGFLILIDDKPGNRYKIYNPVTKSLRDFTRSHGYHKFAGSQIYRDKLVLSGGMEERFCAHDMVHYVCLGRSNAKWTMMAPLPVPMSHHACFSVYVNNKTLTRRENSRQISMCDLSV